MRLSDARIAFFGTPEHAVYVLEELAGAGIVPTLIVTAKDKPVGRKLVLTPPPVKVWAEQRGVEVLQTGTLRDESAIELLVNSEWDLFIVAAYNYLLPANVLALPTFGVLNVHPSLLPKLRGPSPIRTAIQNDERDAVGVSIILLDEEMDHGPLVAQATVELPFWPEKGRILDELLFREGGRLLAEVIPEWFKKSIVPEPQDHAQATYTKKFVKSDGEIDLNDDGYLNYCKYCAFDGWPGTFFFVERGGERKRIKVTDAEYKNAVFTIKKVIPEGKSEIDFVVWKSTQ